MRCGDSGHACAEHGHAEQVVPVLTRSEVRPDDLPRIRAVRTTEVVLGTSHPHERVARRDAVLAAIGDPQHPVTIERVDEQRSGSSPRTPAPAGLATLVACEEIAAYRSNGSWWWTTSCPPPNWPTGETW